MQIVQASLLDYPTIYKIALIVWDDTYKTILSPEQMEYMLDMMYSHKAVEEQIFIKGHQFLLAEENGQQLGFASYEVNHLAETTKIHKLYILPQAQGKGAGKALVAVIEEAARKNKNDSIILNVNRYNPAVHFYLRSGFKNMGDDNIDIGNGYLMEDYLMKKQL
jgi:diamine N-acetyltransferase